MEMRGRGRDGGLSHMETILLYLEASAPQSSLGLIWNVTWIAPMIPWGHKAGESPVFGLHSFYDPLNGRSYGLNTCSWATISSIECDPLVEFCQCLVGEGR